MKEKLLKHPILYSLVASEVIVVIMVSASWESQLDSIELIIEFIMILFLSSFLGLFLI